MNTIPYWLDTAAPKTFPAVTKPISVDVLVVGGGITGITSAYLLQKAGLSVCLIERDRVGRVDTGHTTAHLTHVTDLRLYQLVDNFGRDHARAVWDAGAAAIDQIEEIVMRENIECEFTRVPGYLHAPVEPREKADLEHFKEDARLANEFGFDAEYLEQVPHMATKGVRFADQAKFHPIKYLSALAQSVSGDGRGVFEQSDATEFDAEKRRAKVNGHWVSYGLLVLATHNPLMGETGMVSSTVFQTKLALYTSYVLGAQVPKDSMAEASFWDTNDPYVYLRVDRRNDSDYVIFGGEDHKTGQVTETDNCYRNLENSLRKILPEARVDHRWSGQVIETSDGLPFIGEMNAGQFIATGFSGNGMTFGTLAAMMARDWATETKNPWIDLFAPERKKLKGSAWDYLKENKDYPYYMLRGRLEAPEGDSVAAVKPGEGKILKVNGKRIAVCRDTQGNLHKRSAVCTHMGCIVRWNSAESTWDCPCHGSRFKPDGSNISGPAETPLGKV